MYFIKLFIIACIIIVDSTIEGFFTQPELNAKTHPSVSISVEYQRVPINQGSILLKKDYVNINRPKSTDGPVPIPDEPVPLSFDWRKHDKISPVKNQYQCEAGWAFSAVANIESRLRIQWGKKETLSEQFLIDCLNQTTGCRPALVATTFEKIAQSHQGIPSEKDYSPYADRKLACKQHLTLHHKPITVVGYMPIKPDETLMLKYLFKIGPLSAAINSKSMENYNGGIDEPNAEDCSPVNLNHGVLIVGYDSFYSKETGVNTPFWIIKNSRGTEWGDNGYYYLVRGKNACGIANDVSIPFIK